MRKLILFAFIAAATLAALATVIVVVIPLAMAQGETAPVTPDLATFIWSFVGALLFILGGWLKKTPAENFSGVKALQTLIVALIVALISIAFNIPPAEALSMLNQWIASFLQIATSTGLIALIEFWRLAIWRRLHLQAPGPPKP